jgi:hypothetical protein
MAAECRALRGQSFRIPHSAFRIPHSAFGVRRSALPPQAAERFPFKEN